MSNIKLSELIKLVKQSIDKRPKVKNHDQLVNGLLPVLEKAKLEKGDINVPVEGFLAHFHQAYITLNNIFKHK